MEQDELDLYEQAYPLRRTRYLRMICDPEKDLVWRVSETKDGIITQYIGLCPIDSARIETYKTWEDLPDWIQDRVAVLRMMPPDVNRSVIYNVGRRVAEDVFWVVE